jgi:acyl-coenzyme A thioesterase PaaI-like protein
MKNMDRWLGDGGMPVIGAIGAAITAYGMDSDNSDSGWATGTWTPTTMACNPHGIVQAGVHAILHDALMNFAINTTLDGRDRTKATLEMKSDFLRAALLNNEFVLQGGAVRVTKLIAFAEARVLSLDGALVSKATGTFMLHRE